MDNFNSEDFNKVDNSFISHEKVVLKMSDDEKLNFEILPLAHPIYKSRNNDAGNASDYLDSGDKIVYLAYCDESLCGQIIIHKYWNNFASIWDLRVSQNYRRKGIGKALIEKAIEWSIANKLAGVRLETQDINASACSFYKSIGFDLYGFDKCLYYGIPSNRRETALYWYLLHPS